MNCHGSLYGEYENMPSIIIRILNGLYQIGLKEQVIHALRKHMDVESLRDYEIRVLNGESSDSLEVSIYDSTLKEVPTYDIVRITLFFTTIISYDSRFDEALKEFDYERGFKGGTLGDYPIPSIVRSSAWAIYIDKPTSEDELHALDSYLDGKFHMYTY